MLHKSIRILLSFTIFMIFLAPGMASASPDLARSHPGRFAPLTAPNPLTSEPLLANNPLSNTPRPADGPGYPRSLSAVGGAAFVVEVFPSEYLRYIPNTDNPKDWIYVSSLTGAAYYGGDFVGNDYSQLYLLEYNLNELHSLDTSSGVPTKIGACTPSPGQVWTGATGTADGILYASSTDGSTSSYLYTIDPASGTAHVIGEITNSPSIIDIAINAEGEMYGIEFDYSFWVHQLTKKNICANIQA